MMNRSTGAGDIGPIGTRQVANFTAVIYPLLMSSCRYTRVTSDVGQLDSAIKTQKERRTTPYKFNYYLVVFQRTVSLFSLFLAGCDKVIRRVPQRVTS
jgi:hypothetical protein